MFKWILLFSLWSSLALAQGCGPQNPNCIVPTAPPGTSDNRAASTAFVTTATTGLGFVGPPALGAIPIATGTMTASWSNQATTTGFAVGTYAGVNTPPAGGAIFQGFVGVGTPTPGAPATTVGYPCLAAYGCLDVGSLTAMPAAGSIILHPQQQSVYVIGPFASLALFQSYSPNSLGYAWTLDGMNHLQLLHTTQSFAIGANTLVIAQFSMDWTYFVQTNALSITPSFNEGLAFGWNNANDGQMSFVTAAGSGTSGFKFQQWNQTTLSTYAQMSPVGMTINGTASIGNPIFFMNNTTAGSDVTISALVQNVVKFQHGYSGANNSFFIYSNATGQTVFEASLNSGGAIRFDQYTTAGLLQNDASGNVTTNSAIVAATVAANLSANRRLTVNIAGTTYYIAASTVAW